MNDLLDRAAALVAALDLMETDCDLEATGDDEPSLGWTDRGPAAGGTNDDREQDDSELEDGADDEPSLGWTTSVDQFMAFEGGADPFFLDGEQDGDEPEPIFAPDGK